MNECKRAFWNKRSHGTESTMLDGKLRTGKSKAKKSEA